jgi:hypothetical protein
LVWTDGAQIDRQIINLKPIAPKWPQFPRSWERMYFQGHRVGGPDNTIASGSDAFPQIVEGVAARLQE